MYALPLFFNGILISLFGAAGFRCSYSSASRGAVTFPVRSACRAQKSENNPMLRYGLVEHGRVPIAHPLAQSCNYHYILQVKK